MASSDRRALDQLIQEINGLAQQLIRGLDVFFLPCSLVYEGESGESRFLRRVLYLYSVFYECGAKPLKFCMRQSQFGNVRETAEANLQYIHALRTTSAHTLDPASERSSELVATTKTFFLQNLGKAMPSGDMDWDKCVMAVESLALEVLRPTKAFLELLAIEPANTLMNDGLRRAIVGSLSRDDYERLVPSVLEDLGRTDLDGAKFLSKYIDVWNRRFQTIPELADSFTYGRTFIEESTLCEPRALPITGKDIIALGVKPGPEVARLLAYAKTLETNDRVQLLEKLAIEAKT